MAREGSRAAFASKTGGIISSGARTRSKQWLIKLRSLSSHCLTFTPAAATELQNVASPSLVSEQRHDGRRLGAGAFTLSAELRAPQFRKSSSWIVGFVAL